MPEKELTQAEKDQRGVDFLRGRNESLIFLRKNPRFAQTQENIAKIKELLGREKGEASEWYEENLSRVFRANPDEFTLADEPKEESEPAPQPEVVKEKLYPEQGSLTAEDVEMMDRETYRKRMKIAAFQAEVNALRIGGGR